MAAVERNVPLALACWTAWTIDPDCGRRQPTHAVTGGRTVALCGATTTAQGGAWPVDPTEWSSPLGLCRECLALVEGGAG